MTYRVRIKDESSMPGINLEPKFVDVGSGKRVVILDEEEYHRLLDALDAAEARKALADKGDKELDWREASRGLVQSRVARVRKEKGISQRELARRLGVTPSTVSRWERKDANLTLATLRRLAPALDCGVEDLVG